MAANSINFFQPGTDAAVDANQIARQRQLADMLMKQGQATPQGQMVSGHFVAPGAGSYIAQLASALGGRFANQRADDQERDLVKSLQASRAKEASDFMSALNGSPGRAIQPLTPNDDEGNPMPVAQAEAVAPDRSRAMALALQSQNPQMQAMGGELMKRQMDAAELSDALNAAGISRPGGGSAGAGTGTPQGAAGGMPQASGIPAGVNPQALALMLSKNAQANKLGGVIQDLAKPQVLAEGGTLLERGANGAFAPSYIAPKTEAGIAMNRGPGGMTAGAIPGFADARGQIAGAEAQARQTAESANTMVTIDTPQGPRMMTRAQALQLSSGGQPQPAGMTNPTEAAMGRNAVINDNPSADAAREIAALRSDLEKVPDAASKRMIQAEIDRLSGQMQKYGAAAPTSQSPQLPGIQLQNAAEKVRETKTAEADVARDTARQADIKTANKFLNIASRVKDVFNDGPTDSAVGSVADSAMALVGKSTKGAEAAQRLKALGGWLVSNVPRMEGPQSNFDVANYQVMAADVANDKLPLARRRAALESIEGMMREVASGKAMSAPPEQPSAPQPSFAGKTFKDFGYASQEAALQDAQRALRANPGAKAEIAKRLQSMGVQLPQGAQGSW